MTAQQINGLLSLVLAMAYAGTWLFYFILEAKGSKRAQTRGWWAICGVAGIAAMAWKARHGGSAVEVMLWMFGGAVAMWVLLAGAQARAAMYRSHGGSGARPKHRPKDFSDH